VAGIKHGEHVYTWLLTLRIYLYGHIYFYLQPWGVLHYVQKYKMWNSHN